MSERKMVLDGIYQRYNAPAALPPVWLVALRPKPSALLVPFTIGDPPPPLGVKEYRFVDATDEAAFYRSKP